MTKLTVEIPAMVALRLAALANVSGESVDDLVRKSLDSFAASRESRWAILKSRSNAARAAGVACSLADLGWLDGYTGQSVDELLLFEGTERPHFILLALEQAIQEKVKSIGTLQLSGVERMVLSVFALQREVNNGGYSQFFRNASRQFAPAIVGDLIRMGCTEIADVTQVALDSLNLPELNARAIEAAMNKESTQRDRILERCDIAFYETQDLFE